MRHMRSGYRGLSLLLDLNADWLLWAFAIGSSLFAVGWLASF
jgi:hypothetical protein